MHYLTSNFNLMNSNSLWNSLKRNKVIVDPNYDNFYLSVLNNQLLKKYNTINTIIYIDKENFPEIEKKIFSLKKTFKRNSSKAFFIYFFCNYNLKKKIKQKINKQLIKLKKNCNNLFFETFFYNSKKNMFNIRNLKIIKFPFDISTISFFSKIINEKISLNNSKPYKLIILDCDNTLWGGVLDEDRPSEIKYSKKNKGFSFKDFQKIIKELKNKGFLLSLCSKNNEEDVWNFFKKKKMELQKEDFILSKINWDEKPNNINFIVKSLNLRFEDCIFVDDNILEINKVKNKLKKINTLHLKKISEAKTLIKNDLRFHKLIVSRDDIKKHKQYKLKSKFAKYIDSEKIAPSLIKGLKQRIKVFNCKNSFLKRAEELFNKTNQFNFSLNRHKNSDLLSMVNKKDLEIKLFRLKDKFGDHGIIGAYIVEKRNSNILISDFVLSCRVLSRYVEEYILCYIINKFPNKKVEIMYKKTNINSNLIPKFLEKKYFNLSRKKKNNYYYDIRFNKESMNETKKLF